MQMLIKNLLGHKKPALLVSVLYTLALLLACLVNSESLPENTIEDGDKIFHFFAYFVLTFLWFNVFFRFYSWNYLRIIITTAILSTFFGIVIELLQGILTNSRTADVKDVIANTLGVIVAAILLIYIGKSDVKKM